MARITVEDCLQQINNRFTIIHMAAQRVRQLRKGSEPTLPSKNKDIVLALREIASGKVIIDKNIEKIRVTENNAPILPGEPVEIPETVVPVVAQKDEN